MRRRPAHRAQPGSPQIPRVRAYVDTLPMDGPTIVAVIAVVVAGATSVAAPIIAARGQRRSDAARFAHERAMKDVDEIRELLDQIIAAIPQTIKRQGALRSKHNTSGSTDGRVYMDEVAAFTQAREDLIQLDARLLLRLGHEHPVRTALATTIEIISSAGNDVLTLTTLDQPRPDDWQARSQHERQQMLDANQRFLESASSFVSAPALMLIH